MYLKNFSTSFFILTFNNFELRSKIVFFNFPEHSFRGDILRISPWTFNYLTEDFIYNSTFLYIYLFYMLNRGYYPYKWLWTYAGDKFLKPKAK